jgi:hypothetical protein
MNVIKLMKQFSSKHSKQQEEEVIDEPENQEGGNVYKLEGTRIGY